METSDTNMKTLEATQVFSMIPSALAEEGLQGPQPGLIKRFYWNTNSKNGLILFLYILNKYLYSIATRTYNNWLMEVSGF